MKLVELECKNCGAALKVEKGTDTISCPYCDATYKIDDEAQHIKYDDMENSGYEFEKGRIKAQKEHFQNSNSAEGNNTVAIVAAIVGLVIAFALIISVFSVRLFGIKGNTKTKYSQHDVYAYNMYYSSGNKQAIFVKSMLDNAINSNKTHDDKKIIVKYEDISTTDSEEILGIEKELDMYKEYDVLLDYDDDGFVNVISIK